MTVELFLRPSAIELLRLLQDMTGRINSEVTAGSKAYLPESFAAADNTRYPIPFDSKPIAAFFESLLIDRVRALAMEHHLTIQTAAAQTHYPDLTVGTSDGAKHAVDVKTTRLTSRTRANTMTLGSFAGYFRDRESAGSTTLPYADYESHLVLGALYRQGTTTLIRDLSFFAQPKYAIAKDKPGSGNTTNIGAVTELPVLINGEGPFAVRGEHVFDHYWMNYETTSMAKAAGRATPHYRDLDSYDRLIEAGWPSAPSAAAHIH